MKVIKKINNNVALAQDAKGREMIVFGKGIGFPAMPYELTDLSVVQRTFYDVDEKYFDLLRDVPQEIFLAADDIAENAREELNCPLNPNLTYVLADHLNFAIQRCREGIALQTPLAYDIRHLYPQEYELAHTALTELREQLQMDLPESESVSIALHIITAEAEVGVCTPRCSPPRSSPRSRTWWKKICRSGWIKTVSAIPASPCTCGTWYSA